MFEFLDNKHKKSLLSTLATEVGAINATLANLAKDVIATAAREEGDQDIQPLLRDIAASTLQANTQLENIGTTISTIKSRVPSGNTEYFRFIAKVTPEQEAQLRSISKKIETEIKNNASLGMTVTQRDANGNVSNVEEP